LVAILLLLAVGDDIPATVRSRADFSGAVGRSIEVTAAWSTGEKRVGEAMLLSVVVSGVSNPEAATGPALETTPEWTRSFQFEKRTKRIDGDRVTFEYACRPRDAGTIAVPRIKFVWFRPSAPEGRQVQTSYAEVSSLTVGEWNSRTDVVDRFRMSRGPILVRPSGDYWWWLFVVPVSLLGSIAVQRLFDWVASVRRIRQLDLARERIRGAIQSNDPAAVAMAELARMGIDIESLREWADRLRFSPDDRAVVEFLADAERRVPSC
jgi:hypothetical protein